MRADDGAGARRAPRPLTLAGAVAVLALLPTPAHAHLVTTGLGPLYDGISHLFLSFEDFIPVVAIALLAGLNGPKAGRLALFAVPGGSLLLPIMIKVLPFNLLPTAFTTEDEGL